MPNMSLKKHEMPSQAPEVRNKNFLEVALGYSAETAIEEAKRFAAERGVNIRCLSDYLADSHSECTRTAVINYGGLKKGWAARIAALFDE